MMKLECIMFVSKTEMKAAAVSRVALSCEKGSARRGFPSKLHTSSLERGI